VRTRDAAVLSTLDVVIDVGAVYDPGAPLSLRVCSSARSAVAARFPARLR
jgi:hypothetical protein